MLTPTHVQVAVLRTKELIFKGKGSNDVFVIYSVGKEKYQSTVKEKVSDPIIIWNEGCDIAIPTTNGNKAELVLKVMHKASMGDKFLGRVALPLSEFDPTAKVNPVWYPLKPKVGSEKDTKYRGEIEVRISFLIKSIPENGSSNTISEKAKRSGSFKSSLGSILSLGKSKKKKKDKLNSKESVVNNSTDSLRSNGNLTSSRLNLNNPLPIINDDPGVISEEEDDAPMEFKINRKKSIQSSTGSEASVSISNASVPSTPKQKKTGFQEIFTADSPKTSPKVVPRTAPKDKEFEESLDSSPSPKPRTMRLPSVIVEEPSNSSSSPVQNNEEVETTEVELRNHGTATGTSFEYSHTLPRKALPPHKLNVSASMSNLVDAGSNGKGSVRKTIKSMFSSSKHLSVDEIFGPIPPKNVEKGGGGGEIVSNSNPSDSNSHQSQSHGVGFFMKRRDSLRDLGIPKETFKQYERKSKEELVAIIVSLQATESKQKQKIADLEDYVDNLLLRVLDNAPGLLSKGNSIRVGKDIRGSGKF